MDRPVLELRLDRKPQLGEPRQLSLPERSQQDRRRGHGSVRDAEQRQARLRQRSLALRSAALEPRTHASKIENLRSHPSGTEGPIRAANLSRAALWRQNAGWVSTISGSNFEAAASDAQMSMYGGNFFRNFVYQDKNWSFRGFDLDKGRADAERTVGADMNANDMSFTAFKARGGKLIAYAGMVDSIVTPLISMRSYQAVVAAQGPASDPSTREKTQRFYRLFLAPGVNHCGGGPGPNQFGQADGTGDAEHDMVAALQQWVEKGVAPA